MGRSVKKDKEIVIQNKTDKPDNVVKREFGIRLECEELERQLPAFLSPYFVYLRSAVLPATRLSYLKDIRFFCRYLISSGRVGNREQTADITQAEFCGINGDDVNRFLVDCQNYSVETEQNIYIFENGNSSLARKRSSLSSVYKFLYKKGMLEKSITENFNPVKLQRPSDREIKALQDDEVMRMLDAVSTGEQLTAKEKQYWEKTKRRDKAILILFVTYGLRITELQQLNVSSFNFQRGEFKIYRKRGKESIMPLNNRTVLNALDEYLNIERPVMEHILPGDEDALFLSLQGRRMTDRQIRELVKKYTAIGMSTSRKAGYSPHKLRATAATSLIGRGNSIYDVQLLMDHDNVTTTQLYAAHKMNTKRDLISGFEWGNEFHELDGGGAGNRGGISAVTINGKHEDEDENDENKE